MAATDYDGKKIEKGDMVLLYEDEWTIVEDYQPVICFVDDVGRASRWHERQMTLIRLDNKGYEFFIPFYCHAYIKKC